MADNLWYLLRQKHPRSLWVESTAPFEVDGRDWQPATGTHPAPSDWSGEPALHEFVRQIKEAGAASVTIRVHGFANSRGAVRHVFNTPPPTSTDFHVVYRWPAEGSAPTKSTFTVLSSLPRTLLGVSLALLAPLIWSLHAAWKGDLEQAKLVQLAPLPFLALLILSLIPFRAWKPLAIGLSIPILIALATTYLPGGWAVSGSFSLGVILLLLIGIVTTIALLRTTRYYRDNYRATHHGSHDLATFLDELALALGDHPLDVNIIAHSMGAYTVAHAVRIVTIANPGASAKGQGGAKVRDSLTLNRLVLVSPDVPMPTILNRRANHFRAGVAAFRERVLFSNGGDIVLRLISCTANYFVYPSRTLRGSGRLGALEVTVKQAGKEIFGNLTSSVWGQTGCGLDGFRQGSLSLHEVATGVRKASKTPDALEPSEIIRTFSVVDCTSYRAKTSAEKWRSLLSLARDGKPLTYRQLFFGFREYFKVMSIKPNKPYKDQAGIDCHSGYFQDAAMNDLIYRAAQRGVASALGQVTAEISSTNLAEHGLKVVEAVM